MSAAATTTDMITALVRLREALQSVALPLELPGADTSRAVRDEMVGQLSDYVLPRLIQIDAPLLAVVGGSTGAGKSTLVNALVGKKVTEPGVLRPTTRSPVLVHNPQDAEWFAADRIFPDLARTSGATGDPGALHLVASDTVPTGLAILDAPDIDSVEQRNRTLAAQLLAAADLWLFVTSAARYADQVPWEFLKSAAERSTAVAVVLDRTAPEAVDEVSGHLARMLTARGLRESPLFTVTEGKVNDEGLLPAEHVTEISTWLHGLAADANARAAVVRQTLDGAVRNIARRTYVVADAAAAQEEMAERLRGQVDRAYDEAIERIDEASADGTLLRGEVLARWQELIGTGELLRSLETKVGWLRDRVAGAVRGRPQQVERVTVAVESGLETLILEHAETAAEQAQESWRSLEAGRHLVEDSSRELGRASRDLRAKAERAVRDWQADVLEMVRTEGASKKATARFLAFGVNGLGVALMIVVFAHTAGLTGAEAGIAGGSAVVGQKLLEAVFGDQAVRRLAANAREGLRRRVTELLDDERARYLDALGEQGVDHDTAERLRQVSRRLDDLRFATQVSPSATEERDEEPVEDSAEPEGTPTSPGSTDVTTVTAGEAAAAEAVMSQGRTTADEPGLSGDSPADEGEPLGDEHQSTAPAESDVGEGPAESDVGEGPADSDAEEGPADSDAEEGSADSDAEEGPADSDVEGGSAESDTEEEETRDLGAEDAGPDDAETRGSGTDRVLVRQDTEGAENDVARTHEAQTEEVE